MTTTINVHPSHESSNIRSSFTTYDEPVKFCTITINVSDSNTTYFFTDTEQLAEFINSLIPVINQATYHIGDCLINGESLPKIEESPF